MEMKKFNHMLEIDKGGGGEGGYRRSSIDLAVCIYGHTYQEYTISPPPPWETGNVCQKQQRIIDSRNLAGIGLFLGQVHI